MSSELFDAWWRKKKTTTTMQLLNRCSIQTIAWAHWHGKCTMQGAWCTVSTFIYRNNSLASRYGADKLFKHLWCNEYPHMHMAHTHTYGTMNFDAGINNAIVFLLHANLCWRIAQLFQIFSVSPDPTLFLFLCLSIDIQLQPLSTFSASVAVFFWSWILYAR